MSPLRSTPLVLGFLLLAGPSFAPCGSAAAQVQRRQGPPEPTVARVSPGDRIRIRSWIVADSLAGEFFVDERGSVVLPRVGTVTIAGLGTEEARDTILARYGRIIRPGHVEVTLLRRIGVHGEVREPTLYWVDPTVTLREAVALAGGVTDEGQEDRIVLLRGGQRVEIETDGTAPMESFPLRSGDQIIVPRRSWASLNAPYLISTGVTLISVLAGFLLSGG